MRTQEAPEAIVLFAHGARAPRWAQGLEALRAELAGARPRAPVRLAFLELQAPPLADVLEELAAAGSRAVAIAPVFWAEGGHIAHDLPQLLAEFRQRHPGVSVRVLPVLSELPGMTVFIARTLADLVPDAS